MNKNTRIEIVKHLTITNDFLKDAECMIKDNKDYFNEIEKNNNEFPLYKNCYDIKFAEKMCNIIHKTVSREYVECVAYEMTYIRVLMIKGYSLDAILLMDEPTDVINEILGFEEE